MSSIKGLLWSFCGLSQQYPRNFNLINNLENIIVASLLKRIKDKAFVVSSKIREKIKFDINCMKISCLGLQP